MRNLRIVSVIILVLGVTAFAVSYASKSTKPEGLRKYKQDFVLISSETDFPVDGEPRLNATHVRMVRANGEWKEHSTFYESNGTTHSRVTVGKAEGVYNVDEQKEKLELLSKSRPSPPEYHSEEFLRNHPQFIREDSILGYKAYVSRIEFPDPNEYTEIYRSAITGAIPLKIVFRRLNEGDKIIEAIKIDFGPIDDAMFNTPDFPVSFDLLESKIKAMEAQGNKRLADLLYKQIEDIKQHKRD